MPSDPTARSADAPLPGTLDSPCVGVCRLDRIRQDCLGCRRTLAEIGAWRDLDDTARQQVLDDAAARRATLAREDAPRAEGIDDAQTRSPDSDGGME